MIASAPVQPETLSSKLTPEEIHLLLHGNPDDITPPQYPASPAAWRALYSSTDLVPQGGTDRPGASSDTVSVFACSGSQSRPRRLRTTPRSVPRTSTRVRSRARRAARIEAV